jgi:hypothetical protein
MLDPRCKTLLLSLSPSTLSISYSHELHQERLLLDIERGRRSLIGRAVLHLERYENVNSGTENCT